MYTVPVKNNIQSTILHSKMAELLQNMFTWQHYWNNTNTYLSPYATVVWKWTVVCVVWIPSVELQARYTNQFFKLLAKYWLSCISTRILYLVSALNFPKRYRSAVIQNKAFVIFLKHSKYVGKSIIKKEFLLKVEFSKVKICKWTCEKYIIK